MSDAAPAQYKQKSRKGKKAWRKNVDVTEVASGLDEVRGQIIAGQVARPQQPAARMLTLFAAASLPRSPPRNSLPSTPPATLPSRKKYNRATSP